MESQSFMFPTSFAQQRLWFLDQMVPGNIFYNLLAPVQLSFPINTLILEKSLLKIVARHEVLRTTFASRDGEPFQIISPKSEIQLPIHDLSYMEAGQRQSSAQQIINVEARTPFDLYAGPLIRTALIKMDEAEYVFILSMHHIISDGWSRFVFFNELITIYEALSKGEDPVLPDLPIQYADFAVWQRDYLQGEVLQRHLNFWKETLSDLPMLELPTDKSRPALQTFRGDSELVEFSELVSNEIREIGSANGATLFMTLLTGFFILLHKYSHQLDIAIGVPVANRNQHEIEHLIGYFVNSILIRVDLSGDPDFVTLLHRVRTACLTAYTHEDLPFEKIVEELHPERDLSRNPLFQVSFQLLQFPRQPGSAHDHHNSHQLGSDKGSSVFDLRLTFAEHHQRIAGEIEYSTDLFDKSTIQRMAEHFHNLFSSLRQNCFQPISGINILSAKEKAQLSAPNNSQVNWQEQQLLHRLVETQVLRTPDSQAVAYQGIRMTYEEMNRRANQIAHNLIVAGIGPESLVGVCLERSEKLILVFLGILKAGAAYIPLDPSYPPNRIEKILQDSGMDLLISQKSLKQILPDFNRTLFLENWWPQTDAEKTSNPPQNINPAQVAYVIYTSGSTGKPKGVLISHQAIANHMLWMKSRFPLKSQDIVLQRTPYSFDASVWEFYAPLISGAGLLIAEEGGNKDTSYLARMIADQKVSVLQVVPTLLRALLDERLFGACTSLRRVYCGGEVLTPELVSRFYKTMDAELYNLYGPTETTIDATCHECKVDVGKERVPLGRPIANTRVYVLDPEMNQVPAGVYGELWIGGAGLARGYLNNPALTARCFCPDIFSGEPGSRLYRTGDRVRFRADGDLEYIERIDHQVKLRGYRIELKEIESVIREFSGVRDVLVLPQTDKNGYDRLTAYIVIEPSSARDHAWWSENVSDHLRLQLPDYMVPADYFVLDEIPLKTNGKVDRAMLPKLEIPTDTEVYSNPETETEVTLEDIWCDVLHVKRVSVNDHFFNQLGGNSMLATQLLARIRERFDISISLQYIFRFPTIRAFSKSLDEIRVHEQT
jgi:amino acid adenylation domain-containing protein